MKWRSLQESATEVDRRPLRELFAERKQLINRYLPPDIQAVHNRAIAGIIDDGTVDKAVSVGNLAPEFQLSDHNGTIVSSSDLLAQGPLVICFFRGRWCPFCVGQMEAMNRVIPEINRLGATLIAISPQTVQQSFFMADQHKLAFSLLSDVANKVAGKFGLVYKVPDYQQSIYRRAFINLPFINGGDIAGDAAWTLPIPAAYAVDQAGIVRYASVNADYTERPEPLAIQEAIANL